MVRTHHHQPTLWTGFLREEVQDLWEPWMRSADSLLDDEQLVEQIFEAQGRRWKKSRTRGRMQTPSEVVLRLLVLKHVRNWSYQTVEREVRANLVYRAFARIGGEKVPDAKTLGAQDQDGVRSFWHCFIEWPRLFLKPFGRSFTYGRGRERHLNCQMHRDFRVPERLRCGSSILRDPMPPR